MSWQQYRAEAKIIEKNFAKNLTDPTWANDYQDMHEHWDVQGTLDGKLLKFDIKGMKKVNRWDNKKQDDIAWVEGTNVRGKPGWVKGRADYIVFERVDCWLLVKREQLFLQLLEGLHEDDAEVLCLMKDKKLTDKYKVTKAVVTEAFPDIQWGGRGA